MSSAVISFHRWRNVVNGWNMGGIMHFCRTKSFGTLSVRLRTVDVRARPYTGGESRNAARCLDSLFVDRGFARKARREMVQGIRRGIRPAKAGNACTGDDCRIGSTNRLHGRTASRRRIADDLSEVRRLPLERGIDHESLASVTNSCHGLPVSFAIRRATFTPTGRLPLMMSEALPLLVSSRAASSVTVWIPASFM